jgi:hypothetical protein
LAAKLADSPRRWLAVVAACAPSSIILGWQQRCQVSRQPIRLKASGPEFRDEKIGYGRDERQQAITKFEGFGILPQPVLAIVACTRRAVSSPADHSTRRRRRCSPRSIDAPTDATVRRALRSSRIMRQRRRCALAASSAAKASLAIQRG